MTKAEQTFDMVHGTQRIYRHLLDCMAKPGVIRNIRGSFEMTAQDHGLSPVLAAVAFTLIDREVSFHLMCERSDDARKFLQWKTFSRHRPLPDADYVLIQRRLNGRDVREVMAQVKRGTLADPHLSATVILLVTHVSEAGGDAGLVLHLRGPGIKGRRTCHVKGLLPEWLEERQSVNREFPLGIDIVLVTESGDMLALPRTTLIESEEL